MEKDRWWSADDGGDGDGAPRAEGGESFVTVASSGPGLRTRLDLDLVEAAGLFRQARAVFVHLRLMSKRFLSCGIHQRREAPMTKTLNPVL